MTRIVTTTYRYKRQHRKRKAVAVEVPAVVRKADRSAEAVIGSEAASSFAAKPPANDDRKSAIITVRRPGRRSGDDVPDLPPEEIQRRGDAADALWREMVRRATAKDRP